MCCKRRSIRWSQFARRRKLWRPRVTGGGWGRPKASDCGQRSPCVCDPMLPVQSCYQAPYSSPSPLRHVASLRRLEPLWTVRRRAMAGNAPGTSERKNGYVFWGHLLAGNPANFSNRDTASCCPWGIVMIDSTSKFCHNNETWTPGAGPSERPVFYRLSFDLLLESAVGK